MGERKIVSFDWAMKRILRDKANFGVLEGFLYALLKERIKIEHLIESESNKDTDIMKFNRVDILAETANSEHVIIEIQYAPEEYFFKRLLYATSKDIVDNIGLGENYSKVKKVYSVSIVYFDLEKLNADEKHIDYVYHGQVDFFGLHNHKKVEINKKYLIGYDKSNKKNSNIFPEYFVISVDLFNDEVKDALDEWIYSFKNNKVKENFKADGIDEMGKKLDYLSMETDERRAYDKYLEDLASDRGVLSFAEKKGIEKGREEERILQDKIKGQKVMKDAKIMLADGLSIKKIMKYTGLTEKQIKEL